MPGIELWTMWPSPDPLDTPSSYLMIYRTSEYSLVNKFAFHRTYCRSYLEMNIISLLNMEKSVPHELFCSLQIRLMAGITWRIFSPHYSETLSCSLQWSSSWDGRLCKTFFVVLKPVFFVERYFRPKLWSRIEDRCWRETLAHQTWPQTHPGLGMGRWATAVEGLKSEFKLAGLIHLKQLSENTD